METGTVKTFDLGRDFGFLVPDAGGDDIFIGGTTARRAGIPKLTVGDRLQFERRSTDRGFRAFNPRLLGHR